MKKIHIVLLVVLLFLTGCSEVIVSDSYYIRPIALNDEEKEIIELAKLFDHKLLLEYHVPDKYQDLGIAVVGYDHGKVINETYTKVPLLDHHTGKLVVTIDPLEDFHVTFKNVSGKGSTLTSFDTTKDDLKLDERGIVGSLLVDECVIDEKGEAVIAAYRYMKPSDEDGIRVMFKPNTISDEQMKDICVMVKVKFFE